MLLSEIEKMRLLLYQTINSNSDYESIVKISQELDKLIYDYYLNKYINQINNTEKTEH